MSPTREALILCHKLCKDYPQSEQSEIKEIARTVLYELISKTPPSHCRKIANYKEQIIVINKLQLLK